MPILMLTYFQKICANYVKTLIGLGSETSIITLFTNVSHFDPSLIFAGKSGLTSVEPLIGLNCNGWPPALPANIRLGWKGLRVENSLAYYDTAKFLPKNVLKYKPLCSML